MYVNTIKKKWWCDGWMNLIIYGEREEGERVKEEDMDKDRMNYLTIIVIWNIDRNEYTILRWYRKEYNSISEIWWK